MSRRRRPGLICPPRVFPTVHGPAASCGLDVKDSAFSRRQAGGFIWRSGLTIGGITTVFDNRSVMRSQKGRVSPPPPLVRYVLMRVLHHPLSATIDNQSNQSAHQEEHRGGFGDGCQKAANLAAGFICCVNVEIGFSGSHRRQKSHLGTGCRPSISSYVSGVIRRWI